MCDRLCLVVTHTPLEPNGTSWWTRWGGYLKFSFFKVSVNIVTIKQVGNKFSSTWIILCVQVVSFVYDYLPPWGDQAKEGILRLEQDRHTSYTVLLNHTIRRKKGDEPEVY